MARNPFSTAQVEALVRLVSEIRGRHPAVTADRIYRHSDIDQSTFPAARFGEACTSSAARKIPVRSFHGPRFLRPWTSIDLVIW